MYNSATATIYCAICQAPNPESHKFCQQCRASLTKRYLWSIDQASAAFHPGDLVNGRYQLKQNRIFLDTQPGLSPESPTDIPAITEPYLKLSPYQLHIPQVYGLVKISAEQANRTILLLEQAPIYPDGVDPEITDRPLEGTLMPKLTEVWSQSSVLRQLNWLWQMAQLWQPLKSEGVVTSLLDAKLLRVDGGIIRLLELRFDQKTSPTLVDLAQLWQSWLPTAQSIIAEFFGELCQQLLTKQVRTAEQLIAILDQALVAFGQQQSAEILIATRTDQGPTRQRNEDACYPPSSANITIEIVRGETSAPADVPFIAVCDGIGGHEGGDIAAKLAIATLQEQLGAFLKQSHAIDSATLTAQLEQSTLAVNDVIYQRNNREQRQERQRMGTTLVMGVIQDHELYVTHVGDSRAYRITRTGCRQITLDDDLATREVRLGYTFYREALQHSGSGALVQALGMGTSSQLYPTVQRFVLDEECLFLFCTDGLSDSDRVEEHWQTELLPVLTGKIDVATASQRLVAIANQQNGHDNVTVGLLHCRIRSSHDAPTTLEEQPTVSLDKPLATLLISSSNQTAGHEEFATLTSSKTQQLPAPKRLPKLLFLMVGLGIGGSLLVYWLLPEVQTWVHSTIQGSPEPSISPIVPTQAPDTGAIPTPKGSPALVVGSLIQVNRLAIDSSGRSLPLMLAVQPGQPESKTLTGTADRKIPAGSVLKIVARRKVSDQVYWLQLTVCSTPSEVSPQKTLVGESGWVLESAIAPLVTQDLGLSSEQLGQCLSPSSSPTMPPTVQPTVQPAAKGTNSGEQPKKF